MLRSWCHQGLILEQKNLSKIWQILLKNDTFWLPTLVNEPEIFSSNRDQIKTQRIYIYMNFDFCWLDLWALQSAILTRIYKCFMSLWFFGTLERQIFRSRRVLRTILQDVTEVARRAGVPSGEARRVILCDMKFDLNWKPQNRFTSVNVIHKSRIRLARISILIERRRIYDIRRFRKNLFRLNLRSFDGAAGGESYDIYVKFESHLRKMSWLLKLSIWPQIAHKIAQ